MLGFANVVAMGTLLKEVEIKYLPNGRAVANLYIAVNKRYVKDGEKVDKATFLNCTAFGVTAETISKYFDKGSGIILRGELEDSCWTNKEGKEVRTTKLIINSFNFVGDGKNKQSKTGAETEQPTAKNVTSREDIKEDEIPF